MGIIENKCNDGSSLPHLFDEKSSTDAKLDNLDSSNHLDVSGEENSLNAASPSLACPQSPELTSQQENESLLDTACITPSTPNNDQSEPISHRVATSLSEDQLAAMTSSMIGHRTDDHIDGEVCVPTTISPTILSVVPPHGLAINTPLSDPSPMSSDICSSTCASPKLNNKDKVELSLCDTTAEVRPILVTPPPIEQQQIVAMDTQSSILPLSCTVGDPVISSRVSSSIACQKVSQTKKSAHGGGVDGNVQTESTEPQDKIILYNEPKTVNVADNEGEAVQYATPVIFSDLHAPDKRYHSRGRLDSLEDRNNLDTDSEMQSLSESEKESDREDYFRSRPIRKRQRYHRTSSTSISSSEDERNPFSEPRNDLSIVSSPECELSSGNGGFGLSLSVDSDAVPTASTYKRHQEQLSVKDLSSQLHVHVPDPDLPQLHVHRLNASGTDKAIVRTDEFTDRNVCTGAALQVDSELTLPEKLESKKIGLIDKKQHQRGLPSQLANSSPRTLDKALLDESSYVGQSEVSMSEQTHYVAEELLKPEKSVSKLKPYQSLSDPGASGRMANHEIKPMKTKPSHQVTRTSDSIIESGSHSTSSSDQLQPFVRESFSSLPPSSLDRNFLLESQQPPVSLSAPSTCLHSVFDQPPPPFTHYAAPPPIFRAHVLEHRFDPVYCVNSEENTEVAVQHDSKGNENVIDDKNEQHTHVSTEIGSHILAGQRPAENPKSMPVHHSNDSRSTGSTSYPMVMVRMCDYNDISAKCI